MLHETVGDIEGEERSRAISLHHSTYHNVAGVKCTSGLRTFPSRRWQGSREYISLLLNFRRCNDDHLRENAPVGIKASDVHNQCTRRLTTCCSLACSRSSILASRS